MGIAPTVGASWGVYPVEDLALLAKARVGYSIGVGKQSVCDPIFEPSASHVVLDVGAGLAWSFSEHLGTRIDAGTYGFSLGLFSNL